MGSDRLISDRIRWPSWSSTVGLASQAKTVAGMREGPTCKGQEEAKAVIRKRRKLALDSASAIIGPGPEHLVTFSTVNLQPRPAATVAMAFTSVVQSWQLLL